MNPDKLNVINEVLQQRLSPWLIYIFGSAINGKLRPDSDIDIAFYSDHEHGDYDVFMVAQELADKLGREVDLIDLHKASEVFRAQIVGSRQIIFETDIQRRYWFETQVFEDYVILNERRRPILDRIKERGTIYD